MEKPRTGRGYRGWAIARTCVRTPPRPKPKIRTLPSCKKATKLFLNTVSGGGQRLIPVYSNIIVSDFFRSEMSEYDANYIFVPLEWLQKLGHHGEPGHGAANRCKDFGKALAVVATLRGALSRRCRRPR